MDTREYIESGILELYVYGLLSEKENEEIAGMAKQHPEIENEVVAIEKGILNLSSSFSPFLSSRHFEEIKEKLQLKYSKVVPIEPKRNISQYLGWAAAVVLLLGLGYQFYQLDVSGKQLATAEIEKGKLVENVVQLETKNKQAESVLGIIRDNTNTVVALGGQAVAPESYAKVYWNKEKQTVYIDAQGLPEPPEGKVYQVWALKLNPLTPTSIGLLENFKGDEQKVFNVNNTGEAEAFGITLEPAGGSASPTLEQLYTLGKV